MSVSTEQMSSRQTTISALKPAPVADQPLVSMGFATLQSFELLQRAAKLLSASTLVPKDYQGNLPNCVIALNMAQRIGADPLLVMQNLYVVHGRPGWSAQFLIACFNQCGRFSAIRYKWGGTEGKDDWSCQAWAKELSTGEIITGPLISIGLAKKEGWHQKSGSKWQSIPQLMLMYRAAAWLVRTHAPEISMGLQTDEELHDVYDARRDAEGRFAVELESLRGPSAGKAASEPEQESAIPQFDGATAAALLRHAKTLADLDAGYRAVQKDFADTRRELPLEVTAAHEEMREALAEREGMRAE